MKATRLSATRTGRLYFPIKIPRIHFCKATIRPERLSEWTISKTSSGIWELKPATFRLLEAVPQTKCATAYPKNNASQSWKGLLAQRGQDRYRPNTYQFMISHRITRCLLGAKAKLRKATISFVMSVCPHGTTRLPLHEFWLNMIFELLFRKPVEQIQVSLKSNKYNGYFTWRRFHIFDNI